MEVENHPAGAIFSSGMIFRTSGDECAAASPEEKEPMESIGSILRQRRLERSLSLEEAHQATKITLPNLTALEEDNFAVFPNRVYARAFLRDYSNYLGLDSGELLQRYEEEWVNKQSEAAAENKVSDQQIKPKSTGRAIKWGLALTVLVVAVAAFVFASLRPTGVRAIIAEAPKALSLFAGKKATAEKEPHVHQAPKPQKAEQAALPKTLEHPVAPKPAPAEQAPKHKLVLEVSTIGSAWLEIEADGKIIVRDIVPANWTKTIYADRLIKIRTGNAGAVHLTLNGKKLGPMGPPVQVRSRVFKVENAPLPTN